MKLTSAVLKAWAVLCVCAAVMLAAGAASAFAPAASGHTKLSYDPATQSHPGACSQSTLNVAHAVDDLNANGVLGKYAASLGIHAVGRALITTMDHRLLVLRLARKTVAANHGCTTSGVIFSAGPRTLHRGETVGVALSPKLRARLCKAAASGCEREVLAVHVALPTKLLEP